MAPLETDSSASSTRYGPMCAEADAHGLVEGVIQLSARIPNDARGPAVPLVLRIGDAYSQTVDRGDTVILYARKREPVISFLASSAWPNIVSSGAPELSVPQGFSCDDCLIELEEKQ